MLKSEEPFEELAGAVLDGTFVNWPTVESTAGEVERAVIRQLKIVAEIAELHRRNPSDSPRAGAIAESPFKTLEPFEQWGHLKILEFIGKGSFGEVYRAWNTRLDREVALKLLYPSGAQQEALESSVIHEGRLLARVQHPNVAVIYDAERLDGRVGLWMEFVRGRTLEQILQEKSAFEAADVIDIGIDLCHALSAVHEAGLLHRDIKAQNVMRADSGRVVLMDFGTGRELEGDESSARDVAGTPLYLAPELFAGQQATVQSDIYSAGVLLFHLLTGSYPVLGATVGELRQSHIHPDRTRTDLRAACPGISEKLVPIIGRAIHPDPKSRFDSAESMAAGLEALKPHSRRVSGWKLASYWIAAAACVLAAILPFVLHTGSRAGNPGNPGATGKNQALASASHSHSARQIQVADLALAGKPSPDGRYFSYTESTAGNLAVLDLDSGERHTLTHKGPDSSDSVEQSIFSADGRYLAYSWWSRECPCWQLRTVGMDGGETRVVFTGKDEEGFWPDQWSQDGRVILGCLIRKNNRHSLGLLSVADGTLRLLKELPEEPFADLSPDGRYVVYDRPRTASQREHGIYILAVDGSLDGPLVEGPWDESHPIWQPDGSGVIFASNRSGTSGLCRLAVAGGRAVGEPQILKKDMGAFSPIFLTQQGDLFYSLQTAVMDVYVADIDPATGKILSSPLNPARSFLGSNSSPDWSPDGRSLAYVSRRDAFGRNARVLVVQSLETGSQKEFSLPLLDMPAPRWSQDGHFIAFRGTDSRLEKGVQVMDLQTGAIASAYKLAADVAWTHDGSRMYFLRRSQGIFRMDLRSQAEALLWPAPAGSPANMDGFRLSPDERWLEFTMSSGGESLLCIAPTGGDVPVELFRSQDGLGPAGWIRDGSAVLFIGPSMEVEASKQGKGELWGISIKGGTPWRLGLAMDSMREVRVHPAGTRVAFTSGSPYYQYWVMSNLFPDR